MKSIFIYLGVIMVAFNSCKPSTKTIGNELKINLEPKSNSTVSGFATFKEKNGKVIIITTKICHDESSSNVDKSEFCDIKKSTMFQIR